ncbi:SERPIN domain-containing protein [Aphelenchoides besseyi]|nr:SERPIN domain-containing protein [Aphelenchoides besseyi]KAI6229573.1 SERPIN domain-containing protein [Aphelenchoides besseyi]
MDAQFALDLIQNLNLQNNATSFIVSPLSITLTLTLAYIGSGGETRREFQHRFKINDISEHQLLNRLSQYVELSNADNSLFNVWSQGYMPMDHFIREEYQQKLAKLFGIPFKRLDFGDQELAAKTINYDVSQQTNGKINRIINSNSINPQNTLLLSALYFNAFWTDKFTWSENKPFHLNSKTQRTVEMMHLKTNPTEHDALYSENELFRVLQLPYTTLQIPTTNLSSSPWKTKRRMPSFYFNVFLPKDRFGLDSALAKMNAESLHGLLNRLERGHFDIGMPSFHVEYEAELTSTLKSMGLVSAFDPLVANFSAINHQLPIYINSVGHKATIDVTKYGTVATAATFMKYIPLCGYIDPPIVNFYVDEPFFYMITSRSNDILFSGVYRG